jgi:AraC family transcriptional regulator
MSSAERGAGVLDESAVGQVRGVLREIARSGEAVTRLTSLPPGANLDDHVHDHPYLSLHVLGAYSETGEGGEVRIDGPGAAFHPAGAAHADRIGGRGLTTVVVEFDAGWLAHALGPQALPRQSVYWLEGRMAAGSTRLARRCLGADGAGGSASAALSFLRQALTERKSIPAPAWLGQVEAMAEADVDIEPATLGERLGVSEAWLARAYRSRRGEGLAERRRRRRVEAAVTLLEGGRLPLADVALEAGFCDQSHMNRSFKLLLGCTPAEVRRERTPIR